VSSRFFDLNLFVSLLFLDFLGFSHCEGMVSDLKLSLRLGRDDESRFATEVVLSLFVFSANGRINSPLFIFGVLDIHALSDGFSDLSGENQLGSCRIIQIHTLSHQIQFEFVSSFYHTRHFVVSDIRISFGWVEGDFQVEVGVWIYIATLRSYGKILLVNLRIPTEMSLYITEI
jgi:hypothetical protein